MAKPLILSDNAFDATVLHPTYLVNNLAGTADDATDHEPFRIADNLRALTFWTSVAANVARSLRVDTGVVSGLAPTIVVLDAGHNLGGATVKVQGSTDPTFATFDADSVSATIPTSAGGLPGDANGCLTPEGVWWKTFTPVNARQAWRLLIPALGAGISPIVTGLYLGVAYRLPEYLDAPAAYDYRRKYSFKRNELSEGAVRGKSRPRRFDELDLRFALESGDYAAFETEVTRLLDYGQPWWVCVDDGDAAGAGLMRLFDVPGDLTYDPVADPVHRRIALLLEAVAPRLTI